jgi:hypothetical protein
VSVSDAAAGADEARPEIRAVSADEAPDSPRARARAMRKALGENKSIDLIVPGYEGLLGVRYKPVPEEEWKVIAQRLERAGNVDQTSGLDVAIDLIVAACDGVIWRDEPALDWQLVNDESDVPLRFDQRLAEWLGFEADTAREVVRGVFSPEGSKPISPSVHGDAVAEWMRGNDQAINRALLGK